MKLNCLVLSLITLSVATYSFADEEKKTLTLNSSGIDTLKVMSGIGSLTVTGDENADEIRVDAVIDADDYTLTLEKDGKTAELLSKTDSKVSGWFNGRTNYIDLKVTMPDSLRLIIHDGSGDIRIADIEAAVRINDGSGSITVKNIGNDLAIEDGSGDMRIETVAGSFNFTDGSGSITLEDIGGTVEGEDGSGDFRATKIGGGMQIIDGSGSIAFQDIGGSIDLEDSSGDIKIEDVIGDIAIGDGSGSIRINNVKGHVKIHDGSGDIRVASVSNGLTIDESGSGSVSTQDIKGELILDD